MEQVHDFAEGRLVGDGAIAVAAYFFEHRFHRLNRFFTIRVISDIRVRFIHGDNFQTVKLTMVLLALQGVDHLLDKVIDVEQFEFY